MALRDPLMGHEHGLSKASIIAVHVSRNVDSKISYFSRVILYIYIHIIVYIYIYVYTYISLMFIDYDHVVASIRTNSSVARPVPG